MRAAFCILLAAVAAYAQRGSTAPAGRGGVPKAPATATQGRGGVPASPTAAPAPATGGGTATAPRDLKYPPPRPLQEPNATSFTLSNGMKVYLLPDRDLPMVSGLALVRTGSLLDPPQRIGLAELAGTALRTGGTALKTGEQLDNLIDDVAAGIESSISDSVASLSFSSLKEQAPQALQLFKEMLTQPGFRQDKVEIARSQSRSATAHRNDDPRQIARREFARLIFGKDSPYGWLPDYTSIGRISSADLRAFHQKYFFPANVTLGIMGDFDAAAMKTAIETTFGDWPARQAPALEFPKVTKTPSPGIFLAEKKEATRTFFTIGHLGGERSDKDFAALEVMTAVLGGGPRGRIAGRLRARVGEYSDVTARWNAGYQNPGTFEISGSTKSVSTTDAIKAIEEEIARMRASEVTEAECSGARDRLLNAFIAAHDSRAEMFHRQILLRYYGYPADYLAQYQKALESVTRADVLRVAKQYLNPANLTVVVVANPTLFGEPLEKLGPVTKLDIAIPERGVDVIETSEATIAQGRQILAKAQAAVGGAEKLAAVNDYTMLADYAIDAAVPNIGGSKITQTDRWVTPTTFRQDGTLPIGRVSAYTDGKVGWIASRQGWGALAGTQRSQMLGDLFRVYYRLLLSDRIEGRTVNATDGNTVRIADSSGQVSTVEFDPQTFLPKRVAYDAPQSGGPPIYSEETYDDFREVDGIKVPFKITTSQGGRKFSDVVVNDYKINSGLKPQELARRPQ